MFLAKYSLIDKFMSLEKRNGIPCKLFAQPRLFSSCKAFAQLDNLISCKEQQRAEGERVRKNERESVREREKRVENERIQKLEKRVLNSEGEFLTCSHYSNAGGYCFRKYKNQEILFKKY